MSKIRVAVIGSGAAGLCAIRHLAARSSMFEAVGFEQLAQPGGTWNYTTETGIGSNGLPVQSSMYRNLRTNIPKEVMAYPGVPFNKNLPSFMKHTDVLNYLLTYFRDNDLIKYIKLETKVDQVEPLDAKESGRKWRISYSSVKSPENTDSIDVDAVMVCNGHYEVPMMPKIPGLENFKGNILHSHSYREPEHYKGKTIVCLGGAASGQDISLDIATQAKKVVISHNKPLLQTDLPGNVFQQAGIERMTEDSAIYLNGETEKVDALVLCTGYRYNFPFMSKKVGLKIQNERLYPLYKHIVHAEYPSLFLIGMCKTICPFPQFDCQARFVLSILDGNQILPTTEEMKEDIKKEYEARLEEGLPPRHAHLMGSRQWAYNQDLCRLGKLDPIPNVIQTLYEEVHRTRVLDLPNYKNKQYTLINDEQFYETQL